MKGLLPVLMDHVNRWNFRTFELGRNDCVTFTCEWVDARCGTNYLERVRQELSYTTKLGALREITRAGGYEALVTRFTGLCGTREGAYDVGDIAVFSSPSGETTLGVVGTRLVFAPGEWGIVACGIELVDCLWRLDDLCRRQ